MPSILGESLKGSKLALGVFDLTVVSNDSHTAFQFDVPKKTGWIAVGTGSV